VINQLNPAERKRLEDLISRFSVGGAAENPDVPEAGRERVKMLKSLGYAD